MHEFSLANSIIGKLKPVLRKHILEKKKILVRISVGELIYSDNLKFWVQDMAKRELGPRVRIKMMVEKSDIMCGKCGYCGKAKPMGDHHMIVCPKCSSTNVTVRKGNKIFVVGVEVSRSGGAETVQQLRSNDSAGSASKRVTLKGVGGGRQ